MTYEPRETCPACRGQGVVQRADIPTAFETCQACGGWGNRPVTPAPTALPRSGVMGPVVTPPREPTEAMQQAGLAAMFHEDGDMKKRELYKIVRKGWRAMYDAWARSAPAVPTGVATTPQGETCDFCKGSGAVSEHGTTFPCIVCHGIGWCSGRSTTRDRE